jgi:hypothetical protein
VKKFVIIFSILLTAHICYAENTISNSGNDYLAKCDTSINELQKNKESDSYINAFEYIACLNYLEGFRGGYTVKTIIEDKDKINFKMGFCMTKEVTLEQLNSLFIKGLKNNPETRHEPTAVLFYKTIIKNFPCNKDNQPKE